MVDKVKVRGLRELDRNLKRLELKVAKRILRKSMMVATQKMFRAATSNAAGIRDSGALAIAMGRWSKIGIAQQGQPDGRLIKNKKSMSLFIGPKSKDKKAVAIWNRAHPSEEPITRLAHGFLAEFSHDVHAGGHRYMTRAFDSHKLGATFRFRAELRRQINLVRGKRG